MSQPIIHGASQLVIDKTLANMPQSLLLSGPDGIGLGTVATYIAKKLQALPIIVLPEKDEKIDLDKGVISVASIRRIYRQTRTIETKKRVIIIDYAERMGIPAQNAFLKLLEEPGKGTYFILATHTVSKLLPTVRSRVQSIELRPITNTQSESLLDVLSVQDRTKRIQLLFMAVGLPAELTRLASDEPYFATRSTIVRDARELLQAKTYDKLLIAHKYKDDRPGALALLAYAGNILGRSISTKPQSSLISQIDSLLVAGERIRANGNIRLCLSRLVL